ncbi:hypothetical protein Zmor_027040 [Zophobas morio]|uniref:G-protein coupled receptors family 2 profile 1 domain-containing protein n=1 Tax=Zophobas morio TaxID=2755281 RepID=A0AA38M510_9CUCU|nr:hypothetical protein Zmor_027040 [Zophobas morio]
MDTPVRAKKRRLDHLSWEEKLQRKKLKNRVAAQTNNGDDLECESTFSRGIYFGKPYCPTRFDGWSCWPNTPGGSIANQSCPNILTFDANRKVFYPCDEDGKWLFYPAFNKTWVNYTTCVNIEDFQFRQQINLIYCVGYGVSLVALLVSLALLTYFKSLRCARITVHMNLFSSFAINNFLWLLWYSMVVNDQEVLGENKVKNLYLFSVELQRAS